MNVRIFITIVVLTVVNSYPAMDRTCDCVCGSREENTFPWIVGVFYGPTAMIDVRNFRCSGSLISNMHVLVSGECAEDIIHGRDRSHFATQIRLGNDINYNGIDTVKRNIARVHLHENFEEHYIFDYNIGILQMDQAVSFDNNVQPICLPQSPHVNYYGKLTTAMGLFHTGTIETLCLRSKSQISQIPIWTTEQCAEVPDYKKDGGLVTYNMICAGDYAENQTYRPYIRDFDFGQIFINGEHGSMELIGIYSYGSRSGTLGAPIVYTRVADFVPWIQSKITDQCMCPPKNSTRSDYLDKLQTEKKPTAKNSSCEFVCGFREAQKQIVDGVYVQPTRFPWVVGAYLYNTIFKCSGALVSKRHALFSADCTNEIAWKWPHIEIRFGINARTSVTRGVSRFYKHENYNEDSLDFNIAIWQFDANVDFGFNIQPICLPSSSSIDYAGKSATTSGWYHDKSKWYIYAPASMTSFVSIDKLHRVHVPIWTTKECAESSFYSKPITNNMVCAGEYENGVRRACMEDFEIEQIAIENDRGNMELVGIYSFGHRCGSVGMPTIYTRVANFLPWIQNVTKLSMDACN